VITDKIKLKPFQPIDKMYVTSPLLYTDGDSVQC
jgi:hypothetical protein